MVYCRHLFHGLTGRIGAFGFALYYNYRRQDEQTKIAEFALNDNVNNSIALSAGSSSQHQILKPVSVRVVIIIIIFLNCYEYKSNQLY